MWNRLLSILAATRRPLIVVDFETAGLGGKPPVEYALAYWAPWAPPEMDAVSIAARQQCPEGLTYAVTGRLDPGVPIDPGALRVHGITDADVKGALSYRDLTILGLFRGLDAGDPGQAEGRAIWCGHNIAEADLPWMTQWGYLLPSAEPIACVDTIRMQRRLTRDHPFPLHPDIVPAGSKCPVVGHGLKPYSATLEGLHTAMFGDPAEGGHGAMVDVVSAAKSLCGMVEMWGPLWPSAVRGEDPHAALTAMLSAFDAPPAGRLSWDGWINVDRETGATTWSGKAKKIGGEGTPLTADKDYAKWVCSLPSAPTGEDGKAWCSPATREALADAFSMARKVTPPARRIGEQVDMTRTP